MEWPLTLASGLMSCSLLMLLMAPARRLRNHNGISSACLGIILYRIVRCVFAECGWDFAAIAGTGTGLLLEACILCGGTLLFGSIQSSGKETRNTMIPVAGAVMMCVGRNLSTDFPLASDTAACVAGNAMMTALLIGAVFRCADDSGSEREGVAAFLPVFCAAVGSGMPLPLRCSGWEGAQSAAPLLSALGVSAVIAALPDHPAAVKEVSAGGLSAGMMISYALDCMSV